MPEENSAKNTPPVRQYLYATFVFGRRVTRWRPHDEAVADAVDAGHATRDEWGKVFWGLGAELRRQA